MKCSEKAKEQAFQVLRHFNVQVALADVFSRCQVGPLTAFCSPSASITPGFPCPRFPKGLPFCSAAPSARQAQIQSQDLLSGGST